MDSELVSISDVKALNQSVVAGSAPVFSTLNQSDSIDKRFVTDAKLVVISNTSGTNTGDKTDSEIETSYNNQVTVISQAEAEAGTSTTVRRFTAERIKQAIEALAVLTTVIVDNLTSSSITEALSPNMGRVLNETKADIASPTFTGTAIIPTLSITTGFDLNQEYVDYQSSKSTGVTYTNGSKPRVISVSGNTTGALDLFVTKPSGTALKIATSYDNTSANDSFITGIVPPLFTYRVEKQFSGGSITNWKELE